MFFPFLKAVYSLTGHASSPFHAELAHSQEAFADLCGVHRTFMGTVERGESNLSFSNLVKISTALGVTLSEMLSGLEKRAARPTGDGATNARSDKSRDVPHG